MTIHRQITKVGGSLGLTIPRDFAESMNLKAGVGVRLSLVGRNLVVEPDDDAVPETSFRRAYATVLRRHGSAFEALARFDQTGRFPAARKRK